MNLIHIYGYIVHFIGQNYYEFKKDFIRDLMTFTNMINDLSMNMD